MIHRPSDSYKTYTTLRDADSDAVALKHVCLDKTDAGAGTCNIYITFHI